MSMPLRFVPQLLFLAATPLLAQQPPPAASEPVKAVRQDAISSVKDPQLSKAQVVPTIENAQGVRKVEGLDKVEGVKPPPQKAVLPPPPPPPQVTAPPPHAATSIRPLQGLKGIETLKRQNLEAALQLKTGGPTPAGTGAEKGGKSKKAAADLLAGKDEVPPPQPGPKEDGRNKLQEVKKLLESGS